MSHGRARKRAATRTTGDAPAPKKPHRYEDLGTLSGFPVVYDTLTRTWIVTIHDEKVRFDRPAVIHTTELMRDLYRDGVRRDKESQS